MTELVFTVLAALVVAFDVMLLHAVAGLRRRGLLPVFTGLFELRVAAPIPTLTQLSGHGSRVCELR